MDGGISSNEIDIISTFAGLGYSVVSCFFLVLCALVFSCYIKLVTVLSIVRFGVGIHSLPSFFITGGLALSLSLLVMFPTIRESTSAMDKVLRQHSGVPTDVVRAKALGEALIIWKGFLKKHAGKVELEKFSTIVTELDETESPRSGGRDEELGDSWRVLAPAFLVSELREAFATALALFLPFLIIDLVVAHLLSAVGYIGLSVSLIAFPFKLLLFVMVDGWTLIATNLVSTYVGAGP